MSSYPSPLKLGVFLIESSTQFLDVAPVDMLGMLSKDYVSDIAEQFNKPALVGKGLDIEYYFINETGHSPNQMTGGFKVEVTHSITTCPPLDILVLGGPRPNYRPSPATQKFLQNQYQHVRAFLSICTGHVIALHSGILDGKTATAPQPAIAPLRKEAPHVNWVEKRWVRDGKVWSSGAIANGMDMMAAFMREEFLELREVTETMLGFSDVAARGAEY